MAYIDLHFDEFSRIRHARPNTRKLVQKGVIFLVYLINFVFPGYNVQTRRSCHRA